MRVCIMIRIYGFSVFVIFIFYENEFKVTLMTCMCMSAIQVHFKACTNYK